MNQKVKHWLVIGVPKNWETAFSQPVPLWGLKQRYQAEFQAMEIGDILWFYATNPVGGVIGVGRVKDKYADPINLIWEDELKRREVIWPLRFRIQALKLLPKLRWKDERIKINDFHLFWQLGFQLLTESHVLELMRRGEKIFGPTTQEEIFTGATIAQPILVKEKALAYRTTEDHTEISHKQLQEQLAEIGKLQFYYSELEYPLELPAEKKNLDVVWKREIDGVPTFAFEVELSGMLEKAVERLKFAFRKWNSRPRIIVPDGLVKKMHNILSATEKDFAQQFKIYDPNQVLELLGKKRELKIIEQNLELY
jgi:hypothetical protein